MSKPFVTLRAKRKIDATISTQGFPQENKVPIWSVKSHLCLPNTPNTKSYETLGQELIGNDKALKPFYDCAWKGKYEKLSLLTGIDSLDLPLTSSSLLLKKQEENSWFKINHQNVPPTKNLVKIYFPSSTSSLVDPTESGNTAKDPPKKKRKKASDRLQEANEVMRPLPFRVVGKLPKEFLRKEVKLIKDRLGKWYIAVPVAIGLKVCEKETICALDPVVRTFHV